jgi:hypothetical protein
LSEMWLLFDYLVSSEANLGSLTVALRLEEIVGRINDFYDLY